MEDSSRVADAAAVQRAAAGLRTVRRFLIPFLGIFVAVGTYLYAQQVRRYLTWHPVRARVTSTDLVSVPGDKGSTYKPVVWYAYDRGGETILATGATILSISSSYNWADGIRKRYTVGDSVTAYINPVSPSEGFLLRQLSWFPMAFVVMPLLVGVLMSTATKNAQQGLSLVAADHVPVIDA